MPSKSSVYQIGIFLIVTKKKPNLKLNLVKIFQLLVVFLKHDFRKFFHVFTILWYSLEFPILQSSWIWLSVGRDARLGIWLLRSQWPTYNNPIEPVDLTPSSIRCQLLNWIVLDGVGRVEEPLKTTGSHGPNVDSSQACRYHVQFIPAGKLMPTEYGNLFHLPVLLIHIVVLKTDFRKQFSFLPLDFTVKFEFFRYISRLIFCTPSDFHRISTCGMNPKIKVVSLEYKILIVNPWNKWNICGKRRIYTVAGFPFQRAD